MVYRIEKTTRTVIYLKKAILIRSGSTKNYPIRNIKCTGKEEKINSLREGMHVRLEGMLVLPELPRNPGQFNRRIYESGKKIDFYLENPTVLEVKEQRSGVREVVEIWKTEMMNRCEKIYPDAEAGILEAMLFGEKRELSGDIKELYQAAGISHVLVISGVKTLKLDIPLVPETRINWAFVPLHIAIIYILKLCLDEEIIPRCRFPCSRGYFKKCINWQNKKSFSVSQSYRKSLKNQQKEKKPMAYKKYREMKVYEASGYQYKRTPSIVLKGQWLSELGFDIGDQIEVKCEDGRLIITKANEIWQCE